MLINSIRFSSEFAREAVPKTFIQYLDDLFQTITSSQATAAENLEQAKEKSKLYYDRYTNPQKFEVGDFVYLLREPKNSKFELTWTGPYRITRIIDDLNAEIELRSNKFKIVHWNKLKLAHMKLNE